MDDDDDDDVSPQILTNRQRRNAEAQNFGGFPQQGGFGGFGQQNAGANTFSNNFQNPFGNSQNTGASSIGSNLQNGGQSGQLSAANAGLQSYQNAFGGGLQNNAQSQSANFDPYGLQASNANSGEFELVIWLLKKKSRHM